MKTDLANEVFAIVEAKVRSTPSPSEFEMAYQMRVAADRIRFAIKVTEQGTHQPEQLNEAALQLLDALDRLDSAERSFQRRYRKAEENRSPENIDRGVNGSGNGVRGRV